MMRRCRILLVSAVMVASLALTGLAVAAQELTAERPGDQAFRQELKKEISTLTVSVETTAADMASNLNRTVPTELYKGPTQISGLSADVVRTGAIAVSAADDFLYFNLPVSLSLRYGIFKTPTISMTLKFRGAVSATPDWKIVVQAQYLGLSDLFAEEIKLGTLSIKPRSIVEGLMQPVQKLLSDVASKKANENFALKAMVEKSWRAAQQPMLVDKNYSAWLVISPREVKLQPLFARNNRARLTVGLTSVAEVVVGPQPAARPVVSLPNLQLVNGGDKGFRVALLTDLSFRELVKIASPLLLDKDFGSDGRKVVLKEFDLYGNGDKIVVMIRTEGDVEGTFYLTGKPAFNPQSNLFSVEDVDFDMKSAGMLLTAANWFLHGTIRDKIREKLNMDLTQRVNQLRDLARAAVANVKLGEQLYLKGNIQSVQLKDAMVQKEKLFLQVYADGDATIVYQ